jgi:hypothetical protein
LVDSTSIILLATVAQTVVITLTLLVFIFQFRSQEKSIRESAVQSVMGRYTDYVRMLVEKPELTKLLNQPEVIGAQLTAEDQTLAAYLLLGYGIFEEIYSLYKKRWMDEETWKQWSSFIERMSHQPLFQLVHNFSSGSWDKEFQDYVTELINKGRSGTVSTS